MFRTSAFEIVLGPLEERFFHIQFTFVITSFKELKSKFRSKIGNRKFHLIRVQILIVRYQILDILETRAVI